AEDAAAPFEQDLDQVAQQDEADDEDEDDVGVPEDEEEEAIGDEDLRQVAVAQQEVEEPGAGEEEEQERAEDGAVVLAVAEQGLAQGHGAARLLRAPGAGTWGRLPSRSRST